MGKHFLRVDFDRKDIDEKGEFEGLGSTYGNIDEGYDVVHRGAFDDSLQSRQPLMLYQHDWTKPIGVWTDIKDTQDGLYVRGKLALGTQLGKETHELLKIGALNGLSIGFRLLDWDFSDDHVRHIRKAELWEISVVSFPMNEQARVSAVKNHGVYNPPRTVRELEAFLRDAGMPRSAAKALAASGYAAIAQRDVASETHQEFGLSPDDLDRAIRRLRNGTESRTERET